MTELYLLRHAHAGDRSTYDGLDATRPLSEKGERQSNRLGPFLASVGFVPDAIISSPKVRAYRTAELVALHLGLPVGIDPRLGEALEPEDLDAILTEAGDPARPVLVGHDPDFSQVLGWLANADGLTMKKGAFARVDVRGPVADGRGTLRWLIPPDLLDRGRR
jgi:phosphohistidine phosphatase